MPELTKKDIKEAVFEVLEPFAVSVQKDFQAVNSRLDKTDSRFDQVDSRLNQVDSRLGQVEFELKETRQDVKWMKDNSSELFAKLDRFISAQDKNEQELPILSAHVRRLEKRMEKLEANRK